MAYFVDRVVSCHAFSEPERHYEILPGGRSKRFLASAKDAKGGTASLVGRQASLLEDELPANEQLAAPEFARKGSGRRLRAAPSWFTSDAPPRDEGTG